MRFNLENGKNLESFGCYDTVYLVGIMWTIILSRNTAG